MDTIPIKHSVILINLNTGLPETFVEGDDGYIHIPVGRWAIPEPSEPIQYDNLAIRGRTLTPDELRRAESNPE